MNLEMKARNKSPKSGYDKVAPFYDFMLGLMEGRRGSGWRRLLWSRIEGARILEVGVGTGRNFPYYPASVEVTAIDLSEGMLKRAKNKAVKQNIKVKLELMDVQNLEFKDSIFDTVVASFVFCSVPDPIRGLTEVKRVLKPGGKVVLLEHVLSDNRNIAWFMDWINPLVARIGGENINRRTVENVSKSGLLVEQVTHLGGVFKLIQARKPI